MPRRPPASCSTSASPRFAEPRCGQRLTQKTWRQSEFSRNRASPTEGLLTRCRRGGVCDRVSGSRSRQKDADHALTVKSRDCPRTLPVGEGGQTPVSQARDSGRSAVPLIGPAGRGRVPVGGVWMSLPPLCIERAATRPGQASKTRLTLGLRGRLATNASRRRVAARDTTVCNVLRPFGPRPVPALMSARRVGQPTGSDPGECDPGEWDPAGRCVAGTRCVIWKSGVGERADGR